MKQYWFMKGNGSNGYPMVVLCDAENGNDAVMMAEDAGLFDGDEDSDNVYVEIASKAIVEHFTRNNLVQVIEKK